MTTDNFSILYFVTVLIRGTIIKFRGHRGFNPESSSPESPLCTTAVHSHNMPREIVVFISVWTQRHKKDQRSEISTTGLRSRRSEATRAFAGSELSECHFLVIFKNKTEVLKEIFIEEFQKDNMKGVCVLSSWLFNQYAPDSKIVKGLLIRKK